MKIKQLKVQNYRAFREQVSFEIKPLTLVFGENNAGKSSLVRLLPSIAQSSRVESRVAFTPVSLSSERVNDQDFIHGRSGSPRLYISCEYEDEEYGLVSANYEITFIPEWNFSLISSISFTSGNSALVNFLWEPSPIERDPALHSHRYSRASLDDAGIPSGEAELTLKFQGLMPMGPWDEDLSPLEARLLGELQEHHAELVGAIHWLGPLRHTPVRIERLSYQGDAMTQTGKEATQILADSFKRKSPLFGRVSEWFETVLKHRLNLIEGGFDVDALFSVALSPLNAPNIRIPFADAGTGMSQVLPIIVLGELAAIGNLGTSPVLVFENPELHLHDSIHDDLGRFFIKIASSACKPKLIIETHSENILLALQIAIAEGAMPANDVVVNCVRKLSDGASIVETVTFDADARPSDPWPTTAFSTAPEQARRLFAARSSSLRGAN